MKMACRTAQAVHDVFLVSYQEATGMKAKTTSNVAARLGYFVKAGGKCRKGMKKLHKRVKGRGKRWMCVHRRKSKR